MAIPFLNNIDLSDNQLLNAKLQITSAAPAAEQGQIYFNSATGFLKPRVHDGADWLNLLDTTSIIPGTYVTSTVTNNVDLTLDLSAVDGTSGANERYLTKNNKWAEVSAIPGTYTWGIGVGAPFLTVSSGTNITITGAGTSVASRAGDVITITSNDQFEGTVTSVSTTHAGDAFTANIGNTSTINPSVDITMAGASTDYINGLGNLTVFPAIPQGDVTGIDAGTYISIGDPNTATPTVNALGTATPYVSATDDSKLVARDTNGYAYVKTPASGDNSTKVATTAFVQSSVTGLLEFKGGFNADTGILNDGSGDDLYTDVVIQVGDYYVVTTDGNFFVNAATPLTVGDSVIAQNAVPAPGTTAPVEGDFIVVQSDTDLATDDTVGLGNVKASADGSGIEGISVAYSAGTATVGLDISNLTKVTFVNDNALSLIPMFDDNTGQNTSISVEDLFIEANTANTATGTIAAGQTSGTVTHAFGINTIVQTINSSGDTVFCDITRTANTSVATIAVAEATAITILVQKIG